MRPSERTEHPGGVPRTPSHNSGRAGPLPPLIRAVAKARDATTVAIVIPAAEPLRALIDALEVSEG